MFGEMVLDNWIFWIGWCWVGLVEGIQGYWRKTVIWYKLRCYWHIHIFSLLKFPCLFISLQLSRAISSNVDPALAAHTRRPIRALRDPQIPTQVLRTPILRQSNTRLFRELLRLLRSLHALRLPSLGSGGRLLALRGSSFALSLGASSVAFCTTGLGLCTCATGGGGLGLRSSLCSSEQVGNACCGLGGLGCCCTRGGGAVFPTFAADFQSAAADAAIWAAEGEAADRELAALYCGGVGL